MVGDLQKSIINDGVLFDESLIYSDSDSETSKIYFAGNLCYKRNNRYKRLRDLQYICDFYNSLTCEQILQNKTSKSKGGWSAFCLAFWVFWGVFAVLDLILNPLARSLTSESSHVKGSIPFLENFWIFRVILIALLIGFLILVIARYFVRKHKANKMIADFGNNIVSPAIKEIGVISDEIQFYESQMSDRNYCIIPKYYWDFGELIASYVYNSRASSLKEAINIFEMDKQHQMIVSEQQKQAELLTLQNKILEYNSQTLNHINNNIVFSNFLQCLYR